MKMITFTNLSVIVLAVIMLSSAAQAHFVIPQLTPVDRLVNNAEAYLAKHRNEADAYYTLARIHYLAFSTKRDYAPAISIGPDGQRLIPSSASLLDREAPKVKITKLSDQQVIGHAVQSVQRFNEAIGLEPNNGLYHLGLASLLEEFKNWNDTAKPKELPVSLRGITEKSVRSAYVKAFTVAMIKDSKLKRLPLYSPKDIPAYEAASALVRLSKNTKETLSETETKTIKEAQTAVASFEKLPDSGIITPLVFSLQPVSRLGDLLDTEKTVDFDLRGYGPRKRWPWVKPELGFLIWDPNETGRIESARQMFGGYTFQIFWRTGYDALRALDDNDDGILSGRELDGISVWFDRNGDAVSQPDEVVPLRRLGIVSIAVTANAYDGIHPTNAHGIKMEDGRVLRSWDWMVEPHTASRVATR